MNRDLEQTIKELLLQKQPIILYGPPSVGKSYLLRSISENGPVKNYILCDLNIDKDFREYFIRSLDNGDCLTKIISVYLNLNLDYVQKSLLFLMDGIECLRDKIQLFMKGELPTYFVAATSRIDYLSNFVQEHTSYSKFIKVSTFSFYEFLDAIGGDESSYSDILKAHYSNHKPIPNIIETEIMELFHDYLMVGGYPEAIQRYKEHRTNLTEIRKIHEQIYATTLLRYTNDIPDGISTVRIIQLYDYISQYASDSKSRFMPGHIRRGAQTKEFIDEITFLSDNGALIPVYRNGELYRFEPGDCGIQRYIVNDYDYFYKLDGNDLLPDYFYQNYLYHFLFGKGLKITLLKSDSDCYSPYYSDRICILLLKNNSEINRRKTLSSECNFSGSYIRIYDKAMNPNFDDHNISYYYLEQTQF